MPERERLVDDSKAGFAKAEQRIQDALRMGATLLDLSRLGLTEVPESIGELTQLRHLILDCNELRELPHSIGKLAQLDSLCARENNLKDLPASLANCRKLYVLAVRDNEFERMPECLASLKGLRTISFRRNRLKELPGWLSSMTLLESLLLQGNDDLGIPAEILGLPPDVAFGDATDDHQASNPADILEYYFRSRGRGRPLNEAKLILLGRGEVGKTCLVNRLVHDKFGSTRMTKGISITQWPLRSGIETVRLNVWDFGGQEIQHATHQFFLTERSLYLVVLNGRAGGDDEDAEYWLKFIRTFGASSPTILVLNKFKLLPFDLNRRALQKKYPFIRAFVQTDCKPKRNNGIPDLKREIEYALAAMDDVRTEFPPDWFRIKERLAGMKEPFISFAEYRKICAELGESDPQAQERLARFLNALGIALNFRDDPHLREETVLNPHWITEGVYKIVTSKLLAERQGELRRADLARILPAKAYPPRMHDFLIELMRKFELCFRFHEEQTTLRYLVPELLGKEEPDLGDSFPPGECLNFRYDYRLMPEGLLPRFIVRTHTLGDEKLRWRTGVVLSWEGCRALVKADKHDRQVVARVTGPEDKRRRLLAYIRENFEHIGRELGEFRPTEWVAMKGLPEEWVNWADVEAFASEPGRELSKRVGREFVRVDTEKMMREVDVKPSRKQQTPGAMDDASWKGIQELFKKEVDRLKLFISYAREDDYWRERLAANLVQLVREGLIQVWHDQRISPGERWDEVIRTKLEESDIVLFITSAYLLASEYVHKVELPVAVERHELGHAAVVPVILSTCNWKKSPLGNLQALPAEAHPIKKWQHKDDAFFSVEEGLRKVVRNLRSKAPYRVRPDRPVASSPAD